MGGVEDTSESDNVNDIIRCYPGRAIRPEGVGGLEFYRLDLALHLI